MTAEEYTRRLAQLISEVSDDEITVEEVLAAGHSLSALGLTSLARIRLIDAIEDAFGVEMDLSDEPASFEDVGTLSALVARATRVSALVARATPVRGTTRAW
ncbi:acyl carrier protein [Microbispora sp. NPDC088329]|uniref:acyl carrier protein n=1 Tax=Microbispora sp. NPDC088329 TaxID=3154869 RepID=UPI0034379912